jgi:dipeptidyl aminopeptidase/acylaminoacyl peptidase
MGLHSEIFVIDVAARSYQQLTDGPHAIPPAPAPAWNIELRAGKLVFLFDEPTRFGDVWTLPLGGRTPTRVTSVYDRFAATFSLPRQEKFTWKSADGASIEGLLILPSDYERGKRYPLVVQMHGGPVESDKFGGGSGVLLNYFPVLTGKGYVVLRPNYRGSSGYGNAFLRDLVGHYFNRMPDDILAGVDALIENGVADPDRMVLMGWSAGGHLANKLITMTDRFKAASAGASASNWTSLYAQTDVRYTRTPWFGGTPWEPAAPTDLYWAQSPLKDVARVRTTCRRGCMSRRARATRGASCGISSPRRTRSSAGSSSTPAAALTPPNARPDPEFRQIQPGFLTIRENFHKIRPVRLASKTE